ncbi:MAG: hypothetical protein QOJ85_1975, partial [Solirubrobacteraceae bacterium]|nr:hypothetical protein [Solirubrobacteraceae bacterium]
AVGMPVFPVLQAVGALRAALGENEPAQGR